MIAQSALQNTSAAATPDAVGSFQKGAQLAQERIKLQQAQAKNKQDLQQLQFAKIEKLGSFFDLAAKMPEGGAKQAFIKDYIPNYVNAVGLGDVINPTSLKMMQADPAVSAFIKSSVQRGTLDLNQVLSSLGNPDQLARLVQETGLEASAEAIEGAVRANLGELSEAGKFQTEQANSNRRSEDQIRAAQVRQQTEIASTGEKAVASNAAKLFTDFQGAGGAAGMTKAEKALSDAIEELRSGKVKTGNFAAKVPWGGDVRVLARTNPKLKALMDRVLSTQNIKALSGDPNPTQAQIDAINSRILDPAATPQANIEKLQAELERLRDDKTTKTQLFREQGFLRDGGQSSGNPTSNTQRSGQGSQGAGSTTSGQTRTQPGVSQPQAGTRNIRELDNPTRLNALAAGIGNDLTRLQQAAAAYGITMEALMAKINQAGAQ